MRYRADHDLHIHSYLSPCLGHDMRWTGEAILAYGITSGLKLLCVTDHIWDRKVKSPCQWTWLDQGLDLAKGREILPLPQSTRCKVLHGMEVDMDYMGNLGVSGEETKNFDFLILSPSHLHMTGFTIDSKKVGDSAEEHKRYYMQRMSQLLMMDLPFEKCGLAHFTTCLACPKEPVRIFELFTDGEYEHIFRQVAERGMGVELNFYEEWMRYTPEERAQILRPYRIAKAMRCRFYFGSDGHSPEEAAGKKEFWEQIVDILELKEEDKFPFVVRNLLKADEC